MKRCDVCLRAPCLCPAPVWLVLAVISGLTVLCSLGAAALVRKALFLVMGAQ